MHLFSRSLLFKNLMRENKFKNVLLLIEIVTLALRSDAIID